MLAEVPELGEGSLFTQKMNEQILFATEDYGKYYLPAKDWERLHRVWE